MRTLLILALLVVPFSAGAAYKAVPGTSLLFEKDPKALASSVNLVFRTGSMADPKGKEGLATLAFHSLLRGTKVRGKEEFFANLERLGASIEIDLGAGRTIIGLSTVSENLEPALHLLAEAVLEPALKDSDIEALRQEMVGNLNQELANNRRLLKRIFRQALFRGTNLAFPPEGTLAGMNAIKTDDVRAFLKEQVRSGGAVIAVSTNRPEAEVRGWLEKYFAELPEGSAPALSLPTAEKPQGRTLYVMDRPGSTTSEVTMGHLGIQADNADHVTLEPGMYAFGEDMSSILFQELREKKGWTYGAAGGFDLFDRPRRYPGGFMIYAFPQAEHTEELVLRTVEIFDEFVAKGLDAKKLAYAKKALGNSYPFKFASSRARLTNSLYELIEGAPHFDVPRYRKALAGVSQKTLLAALKRNLDPKNAIIVVVGDPSRTAGLAAKIPGLKNAVKVSDAMAPLP